MLFPERVHHGPREVLLRKKKEKKREGTTKRGGCNKQDDNTEWSEAKKKRAGRETGRGRAADRVLQTYRIPKYGAMELTINRTECPSPNRETVVGTLGPSSGFQKPFFPACTELHDMGITFPKKWHTRFNK